ncbi:MAG: Primary replicative DNA helicase [candidate division TM6 bacterium GW2011_GWF2_32_72]|nr:MAG: Primary replicative DNA helicase [candidate division TM6 bacterium GW2011_GWF2_32_72]
MLKNKIFEKKVPIDTEKALGRSLPAALSAERSVLGGLLLNDKNFSQVVEIITADDFYSPANKVIFQTMQEITADFKRIDIVTLQDELTKKGQLVAIGGVIYLLSLQEDIAATGMAEQHARIIKEKSILRDLISSATDIITNCYDQNQREIDAVLDDAEKTIFNIGNKRSATSFVQLDIWLKKTFEHLSNIKSQSKGITGIPTGLSKLDEMTSGLQGGDLIILAARPSMGKTALALNLASYASMNGICTGIFSLEMAAEQLTLRLLSSESEVPHQNIRNATISSDEWIELTNVAARLAETKLFIDDTAMSSVMDIRTKARKLKIEHNLQFLIIDYLQLLHSTKIHENRHQEVSEISRSLKALAKELNIPILALSQLSRAVDSRMDKRPMLSDLRESGAIEQDADVIMFLYRDIVYNPETENPALSELIIGKQRNGPTGTVYMNFLRELTRFEDVKDY